MSIMPEKRSAAAALSRPCVVIIAMASVERIAYKGVTSNMVTYLTDVVGMSTSAAAQTVGAWSGVTFMLSLASAVLTDSYGDRYSTIIAASLLYVLGFVGVTSWELLRAWMPSFTLFIPLCVISIGQAGYNPALQAFGAEQLDAGDEAAEQGGGMTTADQEKAKVKSVFFQWWYFSQCSGSLVGNSVMSYVQDNFGWVLGFSIPSAAMAISVVVFFCCTPLFIQKEATSVGRPSPINVVRVLKSVLAKIGARKINLPSRDDDNGVAISELESQEKPLKADPKDSGEDAAAAPSVAKVILGLLPIWAIMLMFTVIFQQPMTFFTKQGMLMDHTIGGGAFVIPPAMLQSTITVSIVLLVPIYDRAIIPLINAVTGGSDGITVLQRMGIGMVVSVVAMVIAALVEAWRLHVGGAGGDRLSIFWLLPQYVLLGVSDVFTVVGMQEFFYSQVPSSMRTIGIGLYLSVFGFGSFLGAFVITALELATATHGNSRGWFSEDPRKSHVDKYYWFLALLCAISFLIFTQLCKYYNGKASSGK